MTPREVYKSAVLAERVADRFALEWQTPEARARYLREHPHADPKDHTLKRREDEVLKHKAPEPKYDAKEKVWGHESFEARNRYLKDHPNEDPKKHKVDLHMPAKGPGDDNGWHDWRRRWRR